MAQRQNAANLEVLGVVKVLGSENSC